MFTSYLLKPNFTLNPLTNQYPMIIQLSPIIPLLPKSPNFPWFIINPRLTLKCSVTSKTLNKPVSKTAKREIRRNARETAFVESVSVDTGRTPLIVPKKNFWNAKSIFCMIVILSIAYVYRPKTVLKLQVGLLGGPALSIQRDINLIGRVKGRTQTYVLKETTLALLRRSDYCIFGYSSWDVRFNKEGYERRLRWLSVEERGNFNEDTLVNRINNQNTSRKKSARNINEYIVVTILVAAEGVHKLPTIDSSEDLKAALKKLGSITTNTALNVEVLLNPQYENVTLTEQEMLAGYSHLGLIK